LIKQLPNFLTDIEEECEEKRCPTRVIEESEAFMKFYEIRKKFGPKKNEG
jgi:hypothetical protein